MRRVLRLALAVAIVTAGLAAAAYVVLNATTGSDFVFLPEPAQPVAPVVKVAGETADPAPGGPGILFVAIGIRRATRWEQLFGPRVDGARLVPESAVLGPGQTPAQREQEGKLQMSASQSLGAAVALEALGKTVGVRVASVVDGAPAQKAGIRPGEEILSVDGTAVRRGRLDVQKVLAARTPGAKVQLVLKDDGLQRTVTVTTTQPPQDGGPKRAFLGVQLEEVLPVDVRFLTKDVGGPSAGLAFALEIYDSLTGRKLAAGRRIAVTGEIEADGTVDPIGGVEEKAIGAREAGATLFLVPTDDAPAARKSAPDGLKIVPVGTFDDALRALREGVPAAA